MASEWLDDLKTLGIAAGIATGSIFKSSQAVIPVGDGPYVSLIDTGGTNPDRTQNVAGNAYLRPSAQIMARGRSYDAAQTMLRTFFNYLSSVQNQDVNGTWYVSIRPMQSGLIDLTPEEGTGRARLAFNVLGDRRP